MSRRAGDALTLLVIVAHVGVLVAPAAVLAAAADKGGIPDRDGRVLFVTSVVVGLLSGAMAAHHLRVRRGARREARDAFIAALDALVVLALGSTAILFLALGAYEPAAPLLVNRGWPVLATWALAQLVSAALAELTRAGVARWLASEPRGRGPVN